MSDDSILFGGQKDGADIFDRVRSKASSPPDVLVGLGSIGVMSFTSRLEGRPERVLGRHYSLAKYFPWMAERFNLSADSKFACLSGIARDPIQREDIAHEKLSEWMREWSPTVTHLTPAMGNLLVAEYSAKFPSLRHVFFVGDILTTRDCKALRQLAPACRIVNMYGTTETSRAVSYFEILSAEEDPAALDSLGDTVPAGWGMQNVQVLVVSQKDHTKSGLSAGYLNDPEKKKEKFVDNWFVDNNKWVEADTAKDKGEPWRAFFNGVHDKLYRTGDLGQYLPSGAVRVSGRTDSQVKIRGFRIELNEIDANLSSSPFIQDCKTLVRRNAHEEPKLISYIVPDLTEWFRALQAFIRKSSCVSLDTLKQKLPLNPNGKVDSPNLPFPDAAQIVELKSWEALSETEKDVASLWSTLIPGLYAKTLSGATFFLTGATGFLGAYLLVVKDILERENTKLIAHIRGAKNVAFAKERLIRSLKGYLLWQDLWEDRISCALGDLSKPCLGLDDAS
ncbi:hypothetical protein V8C37DRAFT_399005 [Trichoderma ceciliae]